MTNNHPIIEPKRILVIKNRALGDSVMGLSSLSYLKSIFPHSEIHYAVPGWILPLYKQVKTDADLIFPMNWKTPTDWIRSFNILFKYGPYDLILELNQAGRSGTFFDLFSLFTGTNFDFYNHNIHKKKSRQTHILNWGKRGPAIQRDLEGVWSALFARHWVTNENRPSYLEFPPAIHVKSVEKQKKIIFGMVATRETKLWPIEHYHHLAHKLAKSGYEIIVPLGKGAIDNNVENEMRKFTWPSSLKILKTPLSELPLEMAKAELYIGNDTGLKHIAVALGLKTVTFFGPEEPFEWHPYDEKKHRYYFIHPLECRTKTSHYCGLKTCDSMICLKDITPEKVLRDLLQEGF